MGILKMDEKILQRFKKLINQYVWHINEASKNYAIIINKALPYLEKEGLLEDKQIYFYLNKFYKASELHKSFLNNKALVDFMKDLQCEIEEIKIYK